MTGYTKKWASTGDTVACKFNSLTVCTINKNYITIQNALIINELAQINYSENQIKN